MLPNSHHCEPTGRANARPMTGSAKQSIVWRLYCGLVRLSFCPPLDIRDPCRHAEFPAAHFGEHGDAFADLLVGWTGEAQPQPAAGIGLVGGPFRPRVDGDAGG